jgi:hypothetical protein
MNKLTFNNKTNRDQQNVYQIIRNDLKNHEQHYNKLFVYVSI